MVKLQSFTGALFNWYAVNTRKLCPSGWHFPSDNEFKTLAKYPGMTQVDADVLYWNESDQGTQIKNITDWNGEGNGTSNRVFFALPGGYRDSCGGLDSLGLKYISAD